MLTDRLEGDDRGSPYFAQLELWLAKAGSDAEADQNQAEEQPQEHAQGVEWKAGHGRKQAQRGGQQGDHAEHPDEPVEPAAIGEVDPSPEAGQVAWQVQVRRGRFREVFGQLRPI